MSRAHTKMEECGKSETLRAWRMKSKTDVLEEVEVLTDTYSFNKFTDTKSTPF